MPKIQCKHKLIKKFIFLILIFTGASSATSDYTPVSDPWWLNRSISYTIIKVAPDARINCSVGGNAWQGCMTGIKRKNGVNICRIEIVEGLRPVFEKTVIKHEIIHCMGVKHGKRLDAMMKQELFVTNLLTFDVDVIK